VNDKEEIFLRIRNDLQFMREVFDIIVNEADSFGGKMLRERIAVEREAIRLEKERADRETLSRQVEQEKQQEMRSV
jgi:hypothetical protein